MMCRGKRPNLTIALALLTLAMQTTGSRSAPPTPPTPAALQESWVGTWMAAPQLTEPGNLPPAPGLGDTTLRQIIHVSRGGTRLRVRLSNAFGNHPLAIKAAHIARSAGKGAIVSGSDTVLTFSGAGSVVVLPGTPLVSDPVDVALPPASDLAITLYVTDPTSEITGHPGSRTTSYLCPGNQVSAIQMPPSTATTAHWYYLTGIDVLADTSSAAVVTVGDSLTDGRGTTTDGNDRWPDILAQRLLANRDTDHTAVLNAGIGGNRVRLDGLGPSVLSRLDRDVLAQPGVRWMILWEGINDLGTHSATADELIAAYAQIITRAHARGIRVYGATITPCGSSFYYSPELEAARQQINTWIRTASAFDAVLDFDAVVRDPQKLDTLRASADSGDHLHLNPTGYRMLGEAVPLKLFANNSGTHPR